MSQLTDMLNPARTFDLGGGRVVKYREASLLAVEDALRNGIMESDPTLTGKALSDRVDECLNNGKESSIPVSSIVRVIQAGLHLDNPDVTVEDVRSLFTAGLSSTMVRLCTAIMGVGDVSPVSEDTEKAVAEGNAEAAQAPA